ncbi:MAG: hypothetical protein RL077_759 [Verrucomicrobiota bacterium]|jgi:hypothetical protein
MAGSADRNDLSAKMPEKTKELDQVLTAFLTEVKATTVQTKIGKDELVALWPFAAGRDFDRDSV